MKQLESFKRLIPYLVILALLAYAGLKFSERPGLAEQILQLVIIMGVIPLVVDIIVSLWRRQFGVDLIALLSISGSLLLGENLAGIIILLMLSGGEYLEDFALRRSRKELSHLVNSAPTIAHLKTASGLQDIEVAAVQVQAELIIKPGEVVPVDGIIIEGQAELIEANITGESMPVSKERGDLLYSGTLNQQGVITMQATKTAAESKYQQIVELVKRAEAEKAPFIRLADRYSIVFTAITLVLAGLAWLISGEAVRALTVLVVATPCPLILATPIAFTAGMSQAAAKGIIFKTPGVMELLARPKIVIFDKTGTLTLGVPQLNKIQLLKAERSEAEIVRIIASIEQLSQHILAKAMVNEAKKRNLALSFPASFEEVFGFGVLAQFEGREYLIGKPALLAEFNVALATEHKQVYEQSKQSGMMTAFLVENREVIAVINFEDKPRAGVKDLLGSLKRLSIRLMMLTGDRHEVAAKLAENYGIPEFKAGALPEQKLAEIVSLQQQGVKPVIMVGDGVNDAPALAQADVGIALGTLGSNASTDTSDVVIASSEITRVVDTVTISKRVLVIAKQSIFLGMGFSIGLMILGSFGLFVPVVGALLQEVIDIIVILNALRVRITTNELKHI